MKQGCDIEKLQTVTRERGSLGRHAGAGECQMPGINRLDTYPLFIFREDIKKSGGEVVFVFSFLFFI